MAEVTVVVGTYQGASHLDDCVASLRQQTLPPTRILVVDAASDDDTVATARALGLETLVVPNRGLGYLYNRGVESASTAYVLLSNVDVSYDARCLELLAAALDADPQRFTADAKQLDWEGVSLVHGHTTLRRGRMTREYFPGLRLDHWSDTPEVAPTLAANGASMLVRRSEFLELGGFDESFFMDWEDLDLCWRAWLRGWPSVYVPDAWLRHRVGAVTSAAVAPRRQASSHHNILRFALKCLPPSAAARVVAGELLRAPRHPRATAVAFVRIVLELPEILTLRRSVRPRRELLTWMLRGQPD
jgi:GT2 family glycosyltransferase